MMDFMFSFIAALPIIALLWAVGSEYKDYRQRKLRLKNKTGFITWSVKHYSR